MPSMCCLHTHKLCNSLEIVIAKEPPSIISSISARLCLRLRLLVWNKSAKRSPVTGTCPSSKALCRAPSLSSALSAVSLCQWSCQCIPAFQNGAAKRKHLAPLLLPQVRRLKPQEGKQLAQDLTENLLLLLRLEPKPSSPSLAVFPQSYASPSLC